MNFLHNLRHTCLRRTLFNPKSPLRSVSTSNKNQETISVDANVKQNEIKVEEKAPRHWQSYGFDYVNEQKDYMWLYSINFFFIFFCIGGIGTIFGYYPDAFDLDWAQREAIIELRRREVLGLPLVDRNYVDPATIQLPPDETLGDDDIII